MSSSEPKAERTAPIDAGTAGAAGAVGPQATATGAPADAAPSQPSNGRHLGPPRTSPYPMSRLGTPYDLVDMALEIQKSDEVLAAVAGGQLQLIADQIRALQEQARAVLERTRRDAELHRARCTLQKRPGHIYHLYRNPEGELYFSLLSPEDWKGKPPHEHQGSYRLEMDMSWTPAETIGPRDAQVRAAQRLLGSRGPREDDHS